MEITPRQADALEALAPLQRRAGPTVRELAKVMGVTATAAIRYVNGLREKGLVHPESGDGIVLAELSAEERRNVRRTGEDPVIEEAARRMGLKVAVARR